MSLEHITANLFVSGYTIYRLGCSIKMGMEKHWLSWGCNHVHL